MEELRRELDDARRDAEDARKQLDASRDGSREDGRGAGEPVPRIVPDWSFGFPIDSRRGQRPFNVSAIFTDGKFTYIRADAAELPALYELVDGGVSGTRRRTSINFQVERGVYIVPKVLERGYLAIGKQKLAFENRLADRRTLMTPGPERRADERRPGRSQPGTIRDRRIAAARRAPAARPDVADGRDRGRDSRDHPLDRPAAAGDRGPQSAARPAEPSLVSPERVRSYEQALAAEAARQQQAAETQRGSCTSGPPWCSRHKHGDRRSRYRRPAAPGVSKPLC